jgi:hypothetical protein
MVERIMKLFRVLWVFVVFAGAVVKAERDYYRYKGKCRDMKEFRMREGVGKILLNHKIHQGSSLLKISIIHRFGAEGPLFNHYQRVYPTTIDFDFINLDRFYKDENGTKFFGYGPMVSIWEYNKHSWKTILPMTAISFILIPHNQQSLIEGHSWDYKNLKAGFTISRQISDEDRLLFKTDQLEDDRTVLTHSTVLMSFWFLIPSIVSLFLINLKSGLTPLDYPRYSILSLSFYALILLKYPIFYNEFGINLEGFSVFLSFNFWIFYIVISIICGCLRWRPIEPVESIFYPKSVPIWLCALYLTAGLFSACFSPNFEYILYCQVFGGMPLIAIEVGYYSKNRIFGFLTLFNHCLHIAFVYWIGCCPIYNPLNFPFEEFSLNPLSIGFFLFAFLTIGSISFSSCLPQHGPVLKISAETRRKSYLSRSSSLFDNYNKTNSE